MTATADERTAWLRAHADDPVPVRLLDLMTIIGRLRQIAAEDPIRESLVARLCDSDLPRFQPLLPAEALAIIEEEER